MFCDDNEGVNTPNAEDRPGLSTQDWAKNIRNHIFPNFKHSETWSEEGLSFYAVLIVWFMVSNWEHVSRSDVCKPIPCVFILVSSISTWKSYTSNAAGLTCLIFNVSNVVYFQEICQRPKFIAEGATRFDVEQGE